MRKFAIAAVALLAGCGLSESAFQDQLADEFSRIAELCDAGGTDSDSSSDADPEPCDTYDKDKAKECIDGLKEITECPTDLNWIPASCADACTYGTDSDA